MTTTLDDVRKKRDEPSADPAATAELARLAQEQSLSLPGPDGQFEQFTKTVLENVLNEEMSEYLGDGKNQAPPVRTSSVPVGELAIRSSIACTSATTSRPSTYQLIFQRHTQGQGSV